MYLGLCETASILRGRAHRNLFNHHPQPQMKRNLKGGDEGSLGYQDAGQEINELMEKYLEHLHITGGNSEYPDTDPDTEVPAALVHSGRETAAYPIGREAHYPRPPCCHHSLLCHRRSVAVTAPFLSLSLRANVLHGDRLQCK